jgi:hypothetical protein
MHIKTDNMIDNIAEETHLQYISNLPKQLPLYQGRILVEIVGEAETNLGEVRGAALELKTPLTPMES